MRSSCSAPTSPLAMKSRVASAEQTPITATPSRTRSVGNSSRRGAVVFSAPPAKVAADDAAMRAAHVATPSRSRQDGLRPSFHHRDPLVLTTAIVLMESKSRFHGLGGSWATRTVRVIHIPTAIVDAAGGVKAYVKLLNDCVEAVASLRLSDEALAGITCLATNFVVASAVPLVHRLGLAFVGRGSVYPAFAIVRHMFAQWQAWLLLDYGHYVRQHPTSQNTFVYNYALRHSTARLKPLPADFALPGDETDVYEVDARRARPSAKLVETITSIRYDAARALF